MVPPKSQRRVDAGAMIEIGEAPAINVELVLEGVPDLLLADNDYWETGSARPDLVLADLVEIFHPDLLDHQLMFHRRLTGMAREQ